MTHSPRTCPMPRPKVVDTYFMEHRAKLLDVAAFLDRIDRAAPSSEDEPEDFRVEALRQAAAILTDGKPQRARRMLEFFSDPTTEPLASAAGMKGASGTYKAP